ncbi:TPA: hypothetical protein KEY88_003438 [Serratia marcescens]|nr:hypothetical protein [Serratia marcescens]
MCTINFVESQGFKLALFRHYIAVAFMDEVKRVRAGGHSACVVSDYFIQKSSDGITVKSLSEGMIKCIETKYISCVDMNDFSNLCFGEYKSFLDDAWHSRNPRISNYGFSVLAEICEGIKAGRIKKQPPDGWVIYELEDIFDLFIKQYKERGAYHD